MGRADPGGLGQTDSRRTLLAGSWGPAAAIALIERDGRTWFEDGH